MAQSTWTNQQGAEALTKPKSNAWKFAIAGGVLLAAVVFLTINALSSGTQLYLTVDEFFAREAELADRDVRVSGWVLGDSIEFEQLDENTSRLTFDIVDDLENPGQRLTIVAMNEPVPDLLQGDTQALVEGRISAPGTFTAFEDGLLLKCPSRYEEGAEPPQV